MNQGVVGNPQVLLIDSVWGKWRRRGEAESPPHTQPLQYPFPCCSLLLDTQGSYKLLLTVQTMFLPLLGHTGQTWK